MCKDMESKTSMIEAFISNLSKRLCYENDLSDITWTMCVTSDIFLEAFLRFFFPDEKFGDVFIQREVSDDDSRPDFYFEHDGKIYLIECKIGDRNHHFEQYTRHYKIPNERLGYITNYPMRKEGFVVHTWTELYSYLSKCIPQEELELWIGYLKYIKQVCNIFISKRPMNLDGMYSLYTFYKLLDEVFVCDNERYTSCIYDSRKDTNSGGNIYATPREGVMGKYFEVEFKQSEIKKTWGWMGVYFDREHPLVCIGFDNRESWGKPVYDLLMDKDRYKDVNKGNYFDEPYKEDSSIWFEFMKNEDFNALNTPTEQIALLKSFYCEVLEAVCSIKSK